MADSKITVKWNFKFKQKILDNFSNRQFADLVNSIINNNVLRKVDKGLSPVNGVRMFAKYKDPKKYPGDLKSSNKPNLTLTGNMLSNYEARPTDESMTISVGIHEDAPTIEQVKAKAHNGGTMGDVAQAKRHKKAIYKIKNNKKARKVARERLENAKKGIPARPFIPTNGKTFTFDIMLEIRKAFAYCMRQAIKRGKNK